MENESGSLKRKISGQSVKGMILTSEEKRYPY